MIGRYGDGATSKGGQHRLKCGVNFIRRVYPPSSAGAVKICLARESLDERPGLIGVNGKKASREWLLPVSDLPIVRRSASGIATAPY
jgi:hypothetical protein